MSKNDKSSKTPLLYPYTPHDPYKIPLGMTDGREVVWDTYSTPHMLIAGMHGRSVIQRSVINYCLMNSNFWKVVGFDMTRIELSPYTKYDDFERLATNLNEAMLLTNELLTILHERYEILAENNVYKFNDLPKPFKGIMSVIDNLDFLNAKFDDDEETNLKKLAIKFVIGEILRLGRAVGMNLLVYSRNADADILTSPNRSNIPVRLLIGSVNSETTKLIGDFSDKQLSFKKRARGEVIISVFGNKTKFYSYYAPYNWLDKWLAGDARWLQENSTRKPLVGE